MDIHKPKPWHGLREFLKEYAIIVVGVLTALGAEQAVEWLHWRHLAQETEADLTAALKVDLGNAANWMAAAPCNEAEIASLTQALRDGSPQWHARPGRMEDPAGFPLATPTMSGQPNPLWSHDAWELAVSSGALSHMSRGRVSSYGTAFRLVDLARTWQTQAAMTINQLSALGFDQSISPPEKAGYLNTLAQVEFLQHGIASDGRRIFRAADALGIGLTQKEIDDRVALVRHYRGACAAEVKLPVR